MFLSFNRFASFKTLQIAAVQGSKDQLFNDRRELPRFENSRNVEVAILILTWNLENFSSPANCSCLYFDISFSSSHHVVNVRARCCCLSWDEFFGITHRVRQKGLTRNESSTANPLSTR